MLIVHGGPICSHRNRCPNASCGGPTGQVSRNSGDEPCAQGHSGRRARSEPRKLWRPLPVSRALVAGVADFVTR